MTNITTLFSGFKASWGLNLVLITIVVVNALLSDSRFRTHVTEREPVIEERIVNIEADVASLQGSVISANLDGARFGATLSHIDDQLDSLTARVDLILAELRR